MHDSAAFGSVCASASRRAVCGTGFSGEDSKLISQLLELFCSKDLAALWLSFTGIKPADNSEKVRNLESLPTVSFVSNAPILNSTCNLAVSSTNASQADYAWCGTI